jgi:two-component system, OmpR family, KDP operon response regulator KdpE
MSSKCEIAAGKRILLVEDDPDQLLVRSLLLERQGYVCFSVADAPSALRVAAERHPDCIVMDLHLPTEADGLSLIQSLKHLSSRAAIVVLTGHRVAALRLRPGLQQIDAFVEKGARTTELLAAVTRACRSK